MDVLQYKVGSEPSKSYGRAVNQVVSNYVYLHGLGPVTSSIMMLFTTRVYRDILSATGNIEEAIAGTIKTLYAWSPDMDELIVGFDGIKDVQLSVKAKTIVQEAIIIIVTHNNDWKTEKKLPVKRDAWYPKYEESFVDNGAGEWALNNVSMTLPRPPRKKGSTLYNIDVEDLKVVNMSKGANGTLEQPGRNVKAKSGLNKAMLDQGWSEFVRQVEYKAVWQGHSVQKVNPAYTSQQCNECGHTEKGNRLSQSDFNCMACGHTANADTNAAKNILAAGLAVLACGEDALVTSVKQEPQMIKQLIAA